MHQKIIFAFILNRCQQTPFTVVFALYDNVKKNVITIYEKKQNLLLSSSTNLCKMRDFEKT